MDTATLYLIIAASTLLAVAMIATFGLKGFTAWLDLKRAEAGRTYVLRGEFVLGPTFATGEVCDSHW